jgi:hypothetical protein
MGPGVHVVTQVMAIAIRAEEGWPIEAVLADRDDPEGPLGRWTEGALSDAPEIGVDEVLADPSWRWLNVDLPPNFEHGYIASWKGHVKWVRGTPPAVPAWMPRWMLALPDPDRGERYERWAARVLTIGGGVFFVWGLVLLATGGEGAWYDTVLGGVSFIQGLLLRHARPSIRSIAWYGLPLLFFAFSAWVGVFAARRDLSSGDVRSVVIDALLVVLSLILVLIVLARMFGVGLRQGPRSTTS